MSEEMTPSPDQQPTSNAEGFGLPTLHKTGEVLPPAPTVEAQPTEATPANFAEARALNRFQNANSGPNAGAVESMKQQLDDERAKRVAEAQAALAKAEADPNIISDIPDHLKPKA